MNKITGILIVGLFLVSSVPYVSGICEHDSKINSIQIGGESYYILDEKYTINIEPIAHMGENLCPNPSFEEGDGLLPDGWDHDNIRYSEAYNWDDTNAYSGQKSIGVSGVSEFGDYSWYSTDFIPVDLINNEYLISVYYLFSDVPDENQIGMITVKVYNENKEILMPYGCLLTYSDHWANKGMGTDWFFEEDKAEAAYVRIDFSHSVSYGSSSNPSVDIMFDDVYFGLFEENNPPLKPTIQGSSLGKINQDYEYNFVTTDPDGDDVYYEIDWGDGLSDTIGPYPSGEEASATHSWSEKGQYTITVYACDVYSEYSEPAELPISMPKEKASYQIPKLISWIFERLPCIQQFLNI